MTRPLLEVEDLRVHFRSSRGVNRAVDGIGFTVADGETVAIVGESGSGKSVTAGAILRILPEPPARIAGQVRFAGRDLLALGDADMRKVRGAEIGMIFQDPTSSLNPLLSVGYQLAEPLRRHRHLSRRARTARALEMLDLVGIPEPRRRLADYPFRLSGGMRQRVMIAMAMITAPKLLIADEPTTALDVTIQAQILDLLRRARAALGAAVILITHDLGVVAETADRVVVLYAGRVVEDAPAGRFFGDPRHPYSQALMDAQPLPGAVMARLPEIPGMVPDLTQEIVGCSFASRCERAADPCRRLAPALRTLSDGRRVACHHVAPRAAA